jgi:hypothetical protein
MDDRFPIEDSSNDAEFQEFVAREFSSASLQLRETFVRLLGGVTPSSTGMDHDLIKAALMAVDVQLTKLADNVWSEDAAVYPTTEHMVEDAAELIRSFLIGAMDDLLGRLFKSFEPVRGWNVQIIRQTRRHLYAMNEPILMRARTLIGDITRREEKIAQRSETEHHKAWLRSYAGINSKLAWAEFHVAFPGTKKAIFEALFREAKGVRSRGRPPKLIS